VAVNRFRQPDPDLGTGFVPSDTQAAIFPHVGTVDPVQVYAGQSRPPGRLDKRLPIRTTFDRQAFARRDKPLDLDGPPFIGRELAATHGPDGALVAGKP
jgi:hypothetical protein